MVGGGGESVVLCVMPRTLHLDGGDGGDGAGLRAEAELLLSDLALSGAPGDLARAIAKVVSSGGDSPGKVESGYAEQRRFDRLVRGLHGAVGHRKSMHGRVAGRVARACPAPVVLVTAPGRDEQTQAVCGAPSPGRHVRPAPAGW